MLLNHPNHYWTHNRDAFFKVWDSMTDSFRDAVAGGDEKEVEIFLKAVDRDATYQFNNPNHPRNNKYSFAYSYWAEDAFLEHLSDMMTE